MKYDPVIGMENVESPITPEDSEEEPEEKQLKEKLSSKNEEV